MQSSYGLFFSGQSEHLQCYCSAETMLVGRIASRTHRWMSDSPVVITFRLSSRHLGRAQARGRDIVRGHSSAHWKRLLTDLPNPRGANPDFTTNELLYQLQETKASVLIAHPDALPIAQEAARAAGLAPERIILFDVKGTPSHVLEQHETVSSLLAYGLRNKTQYTERKLAPGEGRTKLAFLSFSSGTTGRPKVLTRSA